MKKKTYGRHSLLLSTILVVFTLMLILNSTNNITFDQNYTTSVSTPAVLSSLNGDNATLEATTNATHYIPGQYLHLWTKFTFDNGTPVVGASIDSTFTDPLAQPVTPPPSNTTDVNGIATSDVIIGTDYGDGNYTLVVNATLGSYNDSKTIFVWIDATQVQIIMNSSQFLIGDIILVYGIHTFFNGTPLNNSLCQFTPRNTTHIWGNWVEPTNSSGIAYKMINTSGKTPGEYEMWVTPSNLPKYYTINFPERPYIVIQQKPLHPGCPGQCS